MQTNKQHTTVGNKNWKEKQIPTNILISIRIESQTQERNLNT